MEKKRHYLSETELKQLQKCELEMLVEFDRICRKYNILYSIDGGTMLGAVRHGGFIPWDDDADVILTRKEYEKLKKVIFDELDNNRFYFQDIDITDGYRWGYGKLRRKNTKFVRINQEHMPYEQGIFMDVFVCDNVPDNYFFRCICNAVSYGYRKAFWAPVGMNTKKGISKTILTVLNKIPEQKLKKSFYKYRMHRNKKNSSLVKCLTFQACNRMYGYKREWYEDVEDIQFEGVKLKAPIMKEEYLTFLYGDYMKLPPIEKRKAHPVSQFQINV